MDTNRYFVIAFQALIGSAIRNSHRRVSPDIESYSSACASRTTRFKDDRLDNITCIHSAIKGVMNEQDELITGEAT